MYGTFVSNIARSFDKALSDIEAVHNFEYGDEFEIAICTTLRTVLPHRFGVCRGYVVDRDGDVAGDDIIIYERMRFPTARLLNEDFARKERVPIEAAFAYLEAKHTLELEGTGGGSISKALDQVAAVKSLCEQRTPVPLGQIARKVNLGPGFNVSAGPGWPEKRNPFYTAILSRRVRLHPGDPTCEDPALIDSLLIGSAVSTDAPPDLIVAGTSNVALPIVARPDGGGNTIASPFYLESGTGFACFQAPSLGFGIGLAHLLWALDYIELGSMPWDRIVGSGLGL